MLKYLFLIFHGSKSNTSSHFLLRKQRSNSSNFQRHPLQDGWKHRSNSCLKMSFTRRGGRGGMRSQVSKLRPCHHAGVGLSIACRYYQGCLANAQETRGGQKGRCAVELNGRGGLGQRLAELTGGGGTWTSSLTEEVWGDMWPCLSVEKRLGAVRACRGRRLGPTCDQGKGEVASRRK